MLTTARQTRQSAKTYQAIYTTKEQYKAFKHGSHLDFDQFCGEIAKRSYQEGYQDGASQIYKEIQEKTPAKVLAPRVVAAKSEPTMGTEQFLEKLSHVKGIGEKTMERIRAEFAK